LILDAEFCTFIQGDLSISDYCRRLKGMANALGDLGEAVLGRTLVLTTLRGLNGRFSHMVSLLKWQSPFSIFVEVCNDLQLEEIEMATKPGSSASALVATTAAAGQAAPTGSTSSSVPHAPVPKASTNPQGPPFSKKNNKNRRTYNNNNNWHNNNNNGLPTASNPWNDTMQIWVSAAAAHPGLLGMHPGSPQPSCLQ
jgi:hypothetical protein